MRKNIKRVLLYCTLIILIALGGAGACNSFSRTGKGVGPAGSELKKAFTLEGVFSKVFDLLLPSVYAQEMVAAKEEAKAPYSEATGVSKDCSTLVGDNCVKLSAENKDGTTTDIACVIAGADKSYKFELDEHPAKVYPNAASFSLSVVSCGAAIAVEAKVEAKALVAVAAAASTGTRKLALSLDASVASVTANASPTTTAMYNIHKANIESTSDTYKSALDNFSIFDMCNFLLKTGSIADPMACDSKSQSEDAVALMIADNATLISSIDQYSVYSPSTLLSYGETEPINQEDALSMIKSIADSANGSDITSLADAVQQIDSYVGSYLEMNALTVDESFGLSAKDAITGLTNKINSIVMIELEIAADSTLLNSYYSILNDAQKHMWQGYFDFSAPMTLISDKVAVLDSTLTGPIGDESLSIGL